MILNDEHRLIQDTARRCAQDHLAPVAARLDKAESPNEDRALFLSHLNKLAELGLMGLNVRADYGGSEAGTVAFSLAITEIARACASTAVTTSVTNMVGEVLQSVASEAQKQQYLPKLCGGEFAAGAFCLSEAGAGSDPSSMATRAEQQGDEWVLNGAKLWITSAEYAGVFVVWAVTDPSAKKGKGISCFLVEAGTPGMTIERSEDKMGQHASSTNRVTFDDCRIPASALVGQVHQGFRIAVGELAGGRIGIASLALGVGLAAIEYATRYIQERQQFGSKIADLQGPQWMVADAYTQLEASRLLTLHAAALKDAGQPFATAASMAKLHASETANKVCYTAIQLMGGLGYTREVPLERYARDARVTSIYEGTSEVQRIIIAREVLQQMAG